MLDNSIKLMNITKRDGQVHPIAAGATVQLEANGGPNDNPALDLADEQNVSLNYITTVPKELHCKIPKSAVTKSLNCMRATVWLSILAFA